MLPTISYLSLEEQNKKFQPIPGAFKTRVSMKCAKSELDDVTGDPEEWITELETLKGYLIKLGVPIDDVEKSTHILSNLTE